MQACCLNPRAGRCVLAVLLISSLPPLRAADWPQYRGPNQDGVSTETIRTNWTAQPPPQLWQVPLGAALSSLSIQNGRVFTMEREGNTIDGRERCVALDAATGQRLWSADVDLADYPHGGVGGDDGPRSTPTADGDRVYALGSYLNLVCLNAANGQVVWSRNLVADFPTLTSGTYRGVVDWQSAGSPLVVGDLVYVASAANTDRLFAFNKYTGALVWRRHNDTMTQASPVFSTIAGVPQIVFFTRSGLVSVNPLTGDQFWRYTFPFSTSSAASPVVGGDTVYCSAAYGSGAGVVRVTNDGGALTATQVWRTAGANQNHWATPVYHDGHYYGVYGQSVLNLDCIDATTGVRKWRRSGVGYGSVLKVGPHLLVFEDDGWVALAQLDSTAYREIDRFQAITGRCWNNPAVADGILYVRSTLAAAAYRVAAPRVELSSAALAPTPAGFELTLTSDDGQPIDSARAARIAVFHTDNPMTPAANWIRLLEPFLTEGNALKVSDPGAGGADRRFYRAEETP